MENHYNNVNKDDLEPGPSSGQKRSLEDEPYRHPKKQKESSDAEESSVDTCSLGSPYYPSEDYSDSAGEDEIAKRPLEEDDDDDQNPAKRKKLDSDVAEVGDLLKMMASQCQTREDSASHDNPETDASKSADV